MTTEVIVVISLGIDKEPPLLIVHVDDNSHDLWAHILRFTWHPNKRESETAPTTTHRTRRATEEERRDLNTLRSKSLSAVGELLRGHPREVSLHDLVECINLKAW